ncbi:eukaryotic translation initiation factor 5-like [Artemia franciscana]|uniref:eukaryotic translation initiation factor 5-like n=1 Tax=Artemia franciscana TaxID=6661 RepID=UPI0032DB99C5
MQGSSRNKYSQGFRKFVDYISSRGSDGPKNLDLTHVTSFVKALGHLDRSVCQGIGFGRRSTTLDGLPVLSGVLFVRSSAWRPRKHDSGGVHKSASSKGRRNVCGPCREAQNRLLKVRWCGTQPRRREDFSELHVIRSAGSGQAWCAGAAKLLLSLTGGKLANVSKIVQRSNQVFGCELGAQTQFDPKNDRYIVNAAHDASKLQDLLNGFNSRFVLCPQCENPETVLSCNAKKQTISQSCKACGHQGLLETRHKLTTYILKNPPEVDPTVQGASLTESQKKGGRKGKKEEDSGAKNGDATVKENDFGDDEDVEWSEDVSADAVKKRQEELAAGVKALAVCEDVEKSEKIKYNDRARDIQTQEAEMRRKAEEAKAEAKSRMKETMLILTPSKLCTVFVIEIVINQLY